MLGLDGCDEHLDGLRKFIPDYRINLVDVRDYETMGRFQSCLQHIFSMLKYNIDKKKLYEYARLHREAIREMDYDSAMAMLVLLGEQKRMAKILDNSEGEEEFDMCQAIDELIADGEARGELRYSQLILKLAEEGKSEKIIKAASDPDFLKQLYHEYGI